MQVTKQKKPVSHGDALEESLQHQEAWQHEHHGHMHASSQELYSCAPTLHSPVMNKSIIFQKILSNFNSPKEKKKKKNQELLHRSIVISKTIKHIAHISQKSYNLSHNISISKKSNTIKPAKESQN
jgi:hypothetical protein